MIYRLQASPTLGAIENSLWPSTGDIDTETKGLDSQITELGRDVFNWFPNADTSTPQVDQFSSGWNAFLDDWRNWRDAAWFWNLTRRDQLLGYRSRFNQLLAAAKSLSVGTLATPQADTGTDPFSKLLGTLTTVAIVAGVGIGAFYGVKIFKEARGR